MSSRESISLPTDWRDLKNSQRFAILRDSPNLVGGSVLPNVEVDCRRRRIVDHDSRAILSFNYPTRGEIGSFTLGVQGHPITGGLEVLSSDERRNELIFVLRRPHAFRGRGGEPHALSDDEIALLASLLETYHNHCAAPPGQQVNSFVVVANQER